jgi:hypothetical protein
MTATNHALTGALIGLSLGSPWLALPAAFASHFVLDAVPHFGFKGAKTFEQWLPDKRFKLMLVFEAAFCFSIVLTLFLVQPNDWLLGAVCAFVAASPDLYSIPIFLYYNHVTTRPVRWNAFRRFHRAIQTERVWGAAVELIWLGSVLSLFVNMLR